MNDLLIAKQELKKGHTLVLCKDGKCLSSDLNGIRPLLGYLKDYANLEGYCLADKIIGKAQAMLIIKAHIQNVYADVLSIEGKEMLKKYNINYEYHTLVEKIINREGNDICPMEKTVKDINDIEEAYKALDNKVKELMSKSNH